MRPCYPALLLAVFAGATDAAADDDCNQDFEPAPGSYAFVEEDQRDVAIPPAATIDEIHYTRLPVFDESNPRENNAVFRFGNRFHILTREETVAQDVLFDSGDGYNAREIEESARILRARDHLYDADVRPVSVCGNEVDVEVITRDVWSFTPEVSFDRSGGDNSFRAGVAESNLLGLGHELSFIFDDDIDRRSSRFGYEDPNVGGSRVNLKLEYTDSDDGFQQFASVGLPFYSLDTRKSWEVVYDKVKSDQEQFFRSDEVTEVRQEIEEARAAIGFSRGLDGDVVRRWKLGWKIREEVYLPTPELPPPAPFPADRRLSYPFIEFQSIEDNYTTAFNLNEIHRTEDLHLGHSVTATLGIAARAFGSNEDRLVARFDYTDTLWFNDRDLLQHFAHVEGFYNADHSEAENVLGRYTLRYFRSRNSHRSFFASLDVAFSHNLDTYRQVVLGGLAGSRAFDNRFQVGDRRVLLKFEERQYTDLHILNLLRVGYAAFLDIGRAWEPGVDDGLDDDVLANVGLGIRLASSKANVGRIIHIDFAVPLTNRDDPGVDSFQLAVNIKNSF